MSEIKFSTVYCAENLLTGKSYIGITHSDFEKYKETHINNALVNFDKDRKTFYKAIRKYGSKSFKWKILFQNYCHRNKLNSLEIFFIAYYNTLRPNGYNMTNGGDGARFPGQSNPWSKSKMNDNRRKVMTRKMVITRNKRDNFVTGAKKAIETQRRNGTLKKKMDNLNKRLREDPNVRGANNHHAKQYLLVKPNGEKLEVKNTLREICIEYNLCYSRIYRFLDKGEIPIPYRKSNKKTNNCTGWSVSILDC